MQENTDTFIVKFYIQRGGGTVCSCVLIMYSCD